MKVKKMRVPSQQPSVTATGGGSASDAEHADVAVIGAGQAGLAIGHHLARQGRRFVIVDGADNVGSAWRKRWDSLVLFTPRRYDALPGLPFPGDPDGYPTRDEVVRYLDDYVTTFELPVRLNRLVRSVTASAGGFQVVMDDETVIADQVVVATGPFHTPRVPAWADQFAPDVFQVRGASYIKPDDVPGTRVLVIGGGNTGFQIAEELSSNRAVHLAVGSRQTALPQKILGRDLFWWLTKTGLIDKSVDTRIGSRTRNRDTLIGSSPRRLKRSGVDVRPRAVGAAGRVVTFSDSGCIEVDAVIWATGYRPDHSWVNIPGVLDDDGQVTHRRGVTGVAGLYFLGLPWQHTRGSALLGWVKDDAEFLAAQIASHAVTKG